MDEQRKEDELEPIIQQLCADTEDFEDLPRGMDDGGAT